MIVRTYSQAASSNNFECQNRRFRVFKEGYWKEQAKTLSLIFSSTEKQKIVKTINACTEITY